LGGIFVPSNSKSEDLIKHLKGLNMKRLFLVLVGILFLGSVQMVLADEVVVVHHDDHPPVHKVIHHHHHKKVVIVHHDDIHHDDVHPGDPH